MRVLLLLTAALLTVTVSGCATRASVGYGDHDRHYHGGPPPHAPAHGYRAKHHHHDMVYDSRLGAYVVLGYDDYYYNDGWYFRYHDGFWQINADLRDRDWRDADHYRVPEGLRHSKHRYREREHRDDRDKHRGRDYDDRDDDRGNGRGRGYQDRDDHPGKGRGRGNDDRGRDWDD